MPDMTAEALLHEWNGKVVPRSFNPGFVTLSYIVSLIGAASTLELINRRTAPKGTFNHLLLISAAVTMGGIAIWCMHYIGNRAIDIADGETELQIAYSGGFTALSFFVPIGVLLAAFVAIGTNNKVSWWRVAVGGTMAGTAICGMHYLGNASISNYACQYDIVNVVGSAIIAVAASITALSLFFIFRATWTNSWWRRGICAVVLAGAVSGMHWCASMGTNYRLVSLNEGNSQLSRNTTVIVVICLSIGACLVMAGTAVYSAQTMKRYAHKAQQVVLAAAIFDAQGRVLVSPDGLLPSEKITDTFLEKTVQDFTVAHPLFHWMFQASRNWVGLEQIITGMSSHLAHLPHRGKDAGRGGIELINAHGELIEDYEVVFRELFCTAAQALAAKLKAPLTQVGVLWDEILPTGGSGGLAGQAPGSSDDGREADCDSSDDFAEKGLGRPCASGYGRGSLMFLVRQVESAREMEALEAAGYRFAELRQVSGIIGSSMQIKTRNVGSKLRNMQGYAEEDSSLLEPGVHLGFFGVRACVGTYGFDVLVRKGARSLLPSAQMALESLEPWQVAFLQQFDRMNAERITRCLEQLKPQLTTREEVFAAKLAQSLQSLRAGVDDPAFEDATLTCKVVDVPCRPMHGSPGPATACLIALRLVIPIHQNVSSSQCEFVPLSFFKVHQLVYRDSPHHLIFSRSVHREIAPIINAVPAKKPRVPVNVHRRRSSLGDSRLPGSLWRRGRPDIMGTYEGSGGNSVSRSSSPRGSTKAGSTKELWSPARTSDMSGELSLPSPSGNSGFDLRRSVYHEDQLSPTLPGSPSLSPSPSPLPPQQITSFGGIMVSQEITIDVHDASESAGGGTGRSQQRGALAGGEKGPAGAAAGTRLGLTTIEMETLPEPVSHHIGAGVIVASAEVESERPTFVDELFAVCVDHR